MHDHETDDFWSGAPPQRRNPARLAALGVLTALLLPTTWAAITEVTGGGQSLRTGVTPAPQGGEGAAAPLDTLDQLLSVDVGAVAADATPSSASADPATTLPQSALGAATAESTSTAATTASSTTASSTAASSTTASSAATTQLSPTTQVSPAPTDASTTSQATTAAPTTRATTPTTQPRVTQPQVSCAGRYTIAVGDFWIRIADSAGVPLSDVLQVNGATANTPMHPGDTICLPVGARTPSPPAPPASAPPAATSQSSAPPTARTTTTAATPTTTTTTTAPNLTYGGGEIEQIIRDVWPDHLEDRALEVAWRESTHQPGVRNHCCYGLFQIYFEVHQDWLAAMGVTSADQLYDPRINSRAAYALYQRSGGWGPWT